MKRMHRCLVALLLTALVTTLLAGCGGNSGGVTQPAPPQTGDTSLFPNTALLSSPADVTTTQPIILDARRSDSEYNAGHIPGAIFAPPTLFVKPGEDEVLLPVNELETVLGNMGITRTSKIIIYDNTTASLGSAGRLFWILEYLGCTDVTVLNGGWDQWVAQDMAVDTAVPSPPVPPPVFTAEIDPTVAVATKESVAEHFLPAPAAGFILIDVRTEEEYQSGHIPGAINFPYDKCFNEDKTVLNFKDLKSLLAAHGITLDKQMVVYSTVGHRSGFFYFLCRLMGYTSVTNYIGSIVDWGKANSTAPVAYPMTIGSTP